MTEAVEAKSWTRLPLREAYRFGSEHGIEANVAAIREMEIEWNLSYDSTVRRGFIVELFEKQGIFQTFKDACWPHGNTPEGDRIVRQCRRIKQKYDDFMSGVGTTDEAHEDEIMAGQEFAYESDLRDYLALHLQILEPGLELYKDQERDGVEYSIEGGRIDILAKDQQGRFVVIELKVSRGRNPTIGQLLYYMGWADKNLPGPERSRGIIVAKEISDDLRLACERVPDVSLYRYLLQVSVEKVYPP